MTMTTEEQLIRLADAGPIVERLIGESPHRTSLFRWRQRGIAGIKLRTAYAMRAHRTTERWLREFFEAVAAAKSGEPTAAESNSPA